jgi:macrodomain Ter protein organizer (MatP/YcbG family)
MAKSTTIGQRARKSAAGAPGPARAKKISITVDSRVLAEIERDAKREGKTLSSHITEALARDLRQRRLAAIVSEFETENGVISERELAEVRAKWRA